MALVVVRCLGCGAGIDVQPDNLLMLCGFCGHVYPSKDLGDIPIHVVPSVSEERVCRAVRRRMAADEHMKRRRIRITGAEGVYVPLFVSRTSVQGSWAGYRRVKQGDSTVKQLHSGRIDQSGDFPLLARRHAREFGLSQLGRVIYDQEPVPIEEVEWADVTLPVLAVDLDNEQADTMIKDEIIDEIGERLKSERKLDAITDFDAEVAIADRFILLVPLWTVTYRYKGGSYRVGVAGGRAEVLAAMEPIFTTQRVVRLVLGAAAIVGIGLVLPIGVLALGEADGDEVLGIMSAIVVGMFACFVYAWQTAKKLVASVNIEWREGPS